MTELRIRRSIVLEIEGPTELVNALATYVMTAVPTDVNDRGEGRIRYRIHARMDVLDADWQVVPAADIVSAALAEREAGR